MDLGVANGNVTTHPLAKGGGGGRAEEWTFQNGKVGNVLTRGGTSLGIFIILEFIMSIYLLLVLFKKLLYPHYPSNKGASLKLYLGNTIINKID
jgi:hypothetical protein